MMNLINNNYVQMKKILLIIMVLIPAGLLAQVDFLEEKNLINSIKKNLTYLHGEGVANSEKDALSIAQDELTHQINAYCKEYLSPAQIDYIDIRLIVSNSCKVQLKRGSNSRVFLYIDKENIKGNPSPCQDKSYLDNSLVQYSNEDTVEIDNSTDIISGVDVESLDIMEFSTETEDNEDTLLSRVIATEDTRSLMNLLNTEKRERKVMWGEVKNEINTSWYVVVISNDKIEAVLDKGDNVRMDFRSNEQKNLRDFGNNKKIWFIIFE